MKAASDNAGKIIDELQLIYNKTRQAAITKELVGDRRRRGGGLTSLSLNHEAASMTKAQTVGLPRCFAIRGKILNDEVEDP